MAIPASVATLLRNAEAFSDKTVSVQAGDRRIPLPHRFWSVDEVDRSPCIKSEWEIPADLIPFYGDWHDVLCLSASTEKIVLLDDQRTTVAVWQSVDDFLKCLTTDESMSGSPNDQALKGVIDDESWLDF